MPILYRYPVIRTTGPYGTTLRLNGEGVVEVATYDGYAYVVIDGTPDQPEGVVLEPVAMTETLRASLKAASPQAQLTARLVVERIRERYTLDEELYLARISIGELRGSYSMDAAEFEQIRAYQDYVEQCRAWGRQQYALLGL